VVHIGIDLHKRESQICWLDDETGEMRQQRIQTRRDRFEAVLGGQRPAEVLIEAGTESEWVARCVEGLGHRVHIVDPNYAPMYPRVRRARHKNDQRDAAAMAEASAKKTYREVHRVSDARRRLRQLLLVREALVRTRTRQISLVRAVLRGEGLRIPSGAAESFVTRVREVAIPTEVVELLSPVLLLLEMLEPQIRVVEAQLEETIAADSAMQRLMTAPRIGAVTSAAFVATLDTPDRFTRASQVASYLGLVPKDDSTGDRRRAGHITKAGPERLRYLLVQAGWGILRGPETEGLPLRLWAEGVARRRGEHIAVVGLARRLVRILWAMWRDGTTFAPTRGAQAGVSRAA
jgi:transposase